jgi:hypothetical protein
MYQVVRVVEVPDLKEAQITVEDQNLQEAVKKVREGNHTLLAK